MNENELKTCACCGAAFPENELVEVANGDFVCKDCLDEHYEQCENCGEWFDPDDLYEVRTGWGATQMWCESCANDDAFRCENCGDIFATNYYDYFVAPNGEWYCESCFDDACVTCEDCGEVLWREDAYWDDDRDDWYCEDCYRNRRGRAIHDYSYKPTAMFHTRKCVDTRIPEGVTDLFFGIEDECDKGDDASVTAQEIQDITDALYIKHDGSLECGFEIVTHPCTLAYHMYEMPWKHICKTARSHGFLSHDARTCGLHVHVGVGQMSPDPAKQDEIVGRIVLLVDRHWDALVKFTRRTSGQLDNWAARPRINHSLCTPAQYIREALNTVHGGRYQAVNLTNRNRNNTIEFRIFNGTLKRDTIVATLQMLDNLCHYAMAHTTEEVLASKFADIVSVAEWKELTEYLAARELMNVCDPAPAQLIELPADDGRPLAIGDRVVCVNDFGGGIHEEAVGRTCTIIGSDPGNGYDWVVRLDDPDDIGHRCRGYEGYDNYYFRTENLARI